MFKLIIFLLTLTFPVSTYTIDSYSVFDLEESVVKIPCDIDSYSPSGNYADIMTVKVASHGYDPDDNSFEYKVSDGEIVGKGKRVKWNLSGVEPGTYTITVSVKHNNNSKKHKPETKTITVEKSNCFSVCSCPNKISISAPIQPTKAGEPMFFNANVVGSNGNVNYEWVVSRGEIIEGQGTPLIKVATTLEMAGEEVKATIKFGGEAFCEETCYNEAYAIGKIQKQIPMADVESLTIDKDNALFGCPASNFHESLWKEVKKDEPLFLVTAKVSENNVEDLEYYYFVSGGEVLGKGSDIIWDLNKELEGKYTITVGVGKDFKLLGKTSTKTVELEQYSVCDPGCQCPSGVTIAGPTKPVKAGAFIALKAIVYFNEKSVYEWKITNGTIVLGQGTPLVYVKVDSVEKDTALEATVEVTDYASCGCSNTDSKSFQLYASP